MEVHDFERLLAAALGDEQGAPRGTGAQLMRAEYAARLERPDLLTGNATLSIEHRVAVPVLLPIEPLGLAIAHAVWDTTDSPPAAIGRSSEGRVGVMVERSGRLKLNWSLKGEHGPAGEMTFTLDLPVCPSGRLILDLPAELVPSVDHGLIQERERGDAASRRWSIDLGGSQSVTLRLGAPGAAGQRKPLALVRQATAYEFSPRGVDVSIQLGLDVHNAPLQRLTLEIDPRLRLVAARYADQDVPWTTGGDAGTRAVLELPEPIVGTGRILRLSALAPLEENKLWRLPVIRAEGTN
jgi:hypothetical protein